MKDLPIGYQEFRKIREGGFLYVDKTEPLCEIARRGGYYFLSRPRRFGKSLTVSTLTELFQGSRELFEGLWAEKNWDWSKAHPVVRIGFASIDFGKLGLEKAVELRLREAADGHGIALEQNTNALRLRELVLKLHAERGPVAVLVDEYDKPIVDYLDDVPTAQAHRDALKNLYSVLKDLDASLHFVFLTGVSKFSRTSIFSELNNLLDLTMHPRYATMLGYTQRELERDFAEHVEAWADKFGGKEKLLAKVKEWYDGYTWDGEQYVYNPFSVLNFFEQGRFSDFWFVSGTPTFLVKLLRERGFYELDGFGVLESAFDSFDLQALSPETLLFQTGYVTIKGRDEFGLYELGYPNREVRSSMLERLVASYTGSGQGRAPAPVVRMAKAVRSGNLEGLKDQFNALLSGIPYDLHQKQEAYYHTVIYLAFQLMGLHVKAEVHSAKGRLDAVVEERSRVYIFEFKVDGSAEAALEQIKTRGYAKPYLGTGKEVLALAVNFSTEAKEVDGWIVERLDKSSEG